MSFIDWSDPDEMFGLLVEFVADERNEADDAARRRFLSRLLITLTALQQRFARLSPTEAADALRVVVQPGRPEFENDPVVEHLVACADELERIN